MIWTTLALFAVSFLVTALLAPEPQVENARPEEFDPDTFPKASEDDPIPLVLGRVRLNGPNTIWYGDFQTIPITSTVKYGIFPWQKKKVTEGYSYSVSLDMALALGPNINIHKIIIDDVVVYETETGDSFFNDDIEADDLFGGEGQGGGWTGSFSFYEGSFSQGKNAYMEALLSEDSFPAYRGISHVVFINNNIGESPTLRRMSFEISSYTNNLSLDFDGRVTDGSNDINPAEALYEIMTDTWRGMSVPTSLIDIDSFIDAAETLQSEDHGCSILVSAPQTGKDIISEILRQIDGVLYEEPSTGKITLKLIRDDYDEGDLDVYDEDDIISITSFTKTAWESVYSEVKVSFSSLESSSSVVAVAQDMATSNMLGKRRTTQVNFPFCYNATLANKLASRELSRLSVPLFRATIEMNRRGYTIRPGQAIKITWPEYGLSEVIVRVQKYDLGELLNNKIVLEVVQDVFAASDPVFEPPEETGWTEPVAAPVNVTSWASPEIPYFLNESAPFPSPEGYTNIIVMPRRPQTNSVSYSVVEGLSGGSLPFKDILDAPYPVSFQVEVAYPDTAGFDDGLDATGITIYQVVGDLETFTNNQNRNGQGLVYLSTGEWITYRGVTNNGGGSYTLTNVRRAVLGTRPRSHSVGAFGYVFDYSMIGNGDLGAELEAGETAYFKMLDSVGYKKQSPTYSTLRTKSTVGLRDLPLRPRFLEIDSQREEILLVPGPYDVTWRSSLRREDRVTFEDDAAETPDSAETYRIDVLIDNVLDVGLSDTGVTSPYSLDLSSSTGTIGEIRVWAVRTSDSAESAEYAFLRFEIENDSVLLSGDEQTGGNDGELLSGDAQTGTDKVKLSL